LILRVSWPEKLEAAVFTRTQRAFKNSIKTAIGSLFTTTLAACQHRDCGARVSEMRRPKSQRAVLTWTGLASIKSTLQTRRGGFANSRAHISPDFFPAPIYDASGKALSAPVYRA